MPVYIDRSLSPYDVLPLVREVLDSHATVLSAGQIAALQAALARASPVDTVVEALEAAYSAVKGLTDPPEGLLVLCARAALMTHSGPWHDKGARAGAIFQVCLRELGHEPDSAIPVPEADPAPQ